MSSAPANPTQLTPLLVSALTCERLTPSDMQMLALAIARDMFSSKTNLRDTALHAFCWRGRADSPGVADEQKSTIYIEPLYEFKLEAVHTRPAIIVRRDNFSSQRQTIADMAHGFGTDAQAVDTVYHLMRGALTMLCVHTVPAVVEAMAVELFDRLMLYQGELVSNIKGIMHFRPAGLSALSRLEEDVHRYAVGVQIECVYQDMFEAVEEGPVMTGVNLGLSL